MSSSTPSCNNVARRERLGMLRRTGIGAAPVLAAVVALIVLAPACSTTAAMRGRINALEADTVQAERNGAIHCAPRELALAKAHLRFARLELDQGYVSRASAHMVIAEPNTASALKLSPPEYCAERHYAIDEIVPEVEEPEIDPDTDGDGIPDSLDMCVLEPEDKDGYLDDDGCPDPDNDGDGIPDVIDKCPNEPEDFDGFEDEDGCPDPDNDKDGVPDVTDICPNEPGPADTDRPGCPVKPSLAIVTDNEIIIMQQITFENNKDKIRPESFPIVDAVADIMKTYPKLIIEVQGHTDNKGTKYNNQKLSERRAAAVMKALVERGISLDRLRSRGYGQDVPKVPNDSDFNRALNRRVQFVRIEGDTK